MKKCNIYASAQSFGFGPTALLLATLDTYHNAFSNSSKITLLGSKNISILLNKDTNGFYVTQPNGVEDELAFLYKSEAYKQYDLFVSFFNPAPILYSWFFNKKSVFHDGFFDFWDISSFESKLEEDLTYIKKCKENGDFEAVLRWYNSTFETNPHQVIFMAHYFASKNYIRNSSIVNAILERFQELKNKPLHRVGCIVDPKIDLIPNNDTNHFLVSLGGSIAPVITLEQNIYYAKHVLHFINEMARRPYFSMFPWRVVCHPLIHDVLVKEDVSVATNVSILSSVGILDFMKMIRQSKAIFTPPGYGTIQEACYANKPIFFIPEQNASQPFNFKTLSDHKFPNQYSLTLTQDMNRGQLIYKEFDVDRMYSDIHTLIYDNKYKSTRDSNIEMFRALLENKNKLREHIKKQLSSMRLMPGGFDGASIIAHGIQEEVISLTHKTRN